MTVFVDAELTVAEKLAVAVAPVLSVTCVVRRYEPAIVGVPDITPLSESSASPVGRCPAVMTQVYGGVPPEAERVAVYGIPTTDVGSELLTICNAETCGHVEVSKPSMIRCTSATSHVLLPSNLTVQGLSPKTAFTSIWTSAMLMIPSPFTSHALEPEVSRADAASPDLPATVLREEFTTDDGRCTAASGSCTTTMRATATDH